MSTTDLHPDDAAAVAEFLEDLKIFATGAYLSEAERESWEPLFSESDVARVGEALIEAVGRISAAGHAGDVEKQDAVTIGRDFLDQIAALEHELGGAVFAEELPEMLQLLDAAAARVGVAELATELEEAAHQ